MINCPQTDPHGAHSYLRIGGDARCPGVPLRWAEPRSAVVTWDWREQPDLTELADAVRDVSGGTVHLHAVDTGSDQYAVVIADRPLDDAQAVYERVVSDG